MIDILGERKFMNRSIHMATMASVLLLFMIIMIKCPHPVLSEKTFNSSSLNFSFEWNGTNSELSRVSIKKDFTISFKLTASNGNVDDARVSLILPVTLDFQCETKEYFFDLIENGDEASGLWVIKPSKPGFYTITINVTTANAGVLTDSLNLIVTCRILYLYDGELTDKNVRFSEFESYLKPRGYYVSPIRIDSLINSRTSDDIDLILIGRSCGVKAYNFSKKITNIGVPILGLGEGGFYLAASLLNANIIESGRTYAIEQKNEDSSNHTIYLRPFKMSVPGVLNVYETNEVVNYFFRENLLIDESEGLSNIPGKPSEICLFITELYSYQKLAFWGYDSRNVTMPSFTEAYGDFLSEEGRNLLENVILWLAEEAYGELRVHVEPSEMKPLTGEVLSLKISVLDLKGRPINKAVVSVSAGAYDVQTFINQTGH